MEDSNERRVLWVGNLADSVTEDLLYELFLQAGPLESVKIPKDRDGTKRNFAFITFKHEESVPYTIALMDNVTLFGRPLKLQTRAGAAIDSNPYLKILHRYRQSSLSNNGTNSPYDKFSRQNSRHSRNGNERNHIQNGQNPRYDMRRYLQQSEPMRTLEKERDHNKSCDDEKKRATIKNDFCNSPSDYQRTTPNKPEIDVGIPPPSVFLRTPPPPLPPPRGPTFPMGRNFWEEPYRLNMFVPNFFDASLPISNLPPFQQYRGNR